MLLDSTNFFITNTRTHVTSQAFAIVGAYGYDHGKGRGRLLGLYAAHDDVGATYADGLDYLEGLGNSRTGVVGRWDAPDLVVTDNAQEVLAGIRTYWQAGIEPSCGPDTGRPYAKRCEWHLRQNALKAMKVHQIGGHKHWLRRRLDTAFLRDEDGMSSATGEPSSQVSNAGSRQTTARSEPRPAGARACHSTTASPRSSRCSCGSGRRSSAERSASATSSA